MSINGRLDKLEKGVSWRDEVVVILRDGKMTQAQVRSELGDLLWVDFLKTHGVKLRWQI